MFKKQCITMLDKTLIFGFLIAGISLIIGGCSSTTQENTYINPCKKVTAPSWLDDEFVGVSRITASSSKTLQKQIAFKRAIAFLVMSKGNAQGSSLISVQRELNSVNQNEIYAKSFKQQSSMKVRFKDINYDVKITNIWKDPCTKEIHIKIKEK